MFDGFVLHPQSEKTLADFLERPNHAVLLSGPAGGGTTSLATELAAKLLNDTIEHLKNEQYYRLITPKNGAIAIETVRELRPFFSLSVPGKSDVKRVVVIDAAETMSGEAQNALLKLLEEPPTGSVLILTSTRPERLLATVRSRLHILPVVNPDQSDVTRHFSTKGHAEADINRAYLMTGGSIAGMKAMLEAEGEGDSTFDTVKIVLSSQPFERLVEVEKLVKDKEAAVACVAALLQVAGVSTERAAASNPASLPRWQNIMAAATTAQNALARNGSTKLVLTDLMLTL